MRWVWSIGLSLCLLGCAKQIERPDASVRRDQPQAPGVAILGINPTVDMSGGSVQQLDEALKKLTFVYASTHHLFPEALLVQYREQASSDTEDTLMILDDGGWVHQVALHSKDIISCEEDKAETPPEGGEASLSFQSYADVMSPQETNSHLVLYEINSGQEGAEAVPNYVEIIFDGDGSKFFPTMFRFTDSGLGKVACFSPVNL